MSDRREKWKERNAQAGAKKKRIKYQRFTQSGKLLFSEVFQIKNSVAVYFFFLHSGDFYRMEITKSLKLKFFWWMTPRPPCFGLESLSIFEFSRLASMKGSSIHKVIVEGEQNKSLDYNSTLISSLSPDSEERESFCYFNLLTNFPFSLPNNPST